MGPPRQPVCVGAASFAGARPLLRSHRALVKIALGLLAAEFAQQLGLGFRLYAFGHQAQAQIDALHAERARLRRAVPLPCIRTQPAV